MATHVDMLFLFCVFNPTSSSCAPPPPPPEKRLVNPACDDELSSLQGELQHRCRRSPAFGRVSFTAAFFFVLFNDRSLSAICCHYIYNLFTYNCKYILGDNGLGIIVIKIAVFEKRG